MTVKEKIDLIDELIREAYNLGRASRGLFDLEEYSTKEKRVEELKAKLFEELT